MQLVDAIGPCYFCPSNVGIARNAMFLLSDPKPALHSLLTIYFLNIPQNILKVLSRISRPIDEPHQHINPQVASLPDDFFSVRQADLI